MKFTWGTGIFIFIMIFISLGIAFIIFAFSFDVNLVHPDYYQKGVDYSKQIAINADSKKFEKSIEFKDLGDEVEIKFSEEVKPSEGKMNIFFFRPSDRRLDKKYRKEILNNSCKLSDDSLIFGRYILILDWEQESKHYHIEKNISINK